MKKLLFALPLFALTACGEEPAPEPVPSETAVAEPVEPGLPPADEELFAGLVAEACPNAEPVSTSVCQRAMGSDEAVCEFGLGDDEALRNETTIAGVDGEWQITDADALCAEI